jgi:hypothetical protein
MIAQLRNAATTYATRSGCGTRIRAHSVAVVERWGLSADHGSHVVNPHEGHRFDGEDAGEPVQILGPRLLTIS